VFNYQAPCGWSPIPPINDVIQVTGTLLLSFASSCSMCAYSLLADMAPPVPLCLMLRRRSTCVTASAEHPSAWLANNMAVGVLQDATRLERSWLPHSAAEPSCALPFAVRSVLMPHGVCREYEWPTITLTQMFCC
jgi:hypothetical protein